MGDNKKIMNEACDRHDLLPSEAKETLAKEIESIAKFGPFKTWILTPASLVWIELVSSTGFFIAGIFLIFNLLNCVGKFSKIPWNFIEMVFCIAMAFFYFTCGLDLFVKGSRFK